MVFKKEGDRESCFFDRGQANGYVSEARPLSKKTKAVMRNARSISGVCGPFFYDITVTRSGRTRYSRR